MNKIISKETLITHFKKPPKTQFFSTSLTALNLAAVLIPILDNQQSLDVLFTQRTAHLKHHANQICFPGGKMELTDDSLITTALRETYEEIGITKDQITLIGQLPPLISSSKFLVTPVIGLIASPLNLNLDSHEVKATFSVPLDYLFDPQHLQQETFIQAKKHHKIYVIQYKAHRIWGLTAEIIVKLREELLESL